MAQARRRPPPTARRRPPPGRRAPPPPAEDEEYGEEVAEEQPFWERIILSKSFRLVVGSTFAAAAIAVLVFLIGPANVSRGVGYISSVVSRQSGRLSGLAASAIASSIQE